MRKLLPVFLLLFQFPLWGQSSSIIKGKITDRKGEALPSANIYVKGSYDGASSDVNGNFSFKISPKDTVVIAVSFIGYESFEQKIIFKDVSTELNIQLREAFTHS